MKLDVASIALGPTVSPLPIPNGKNSNSMKSMILLLVWSVLLLYLLEEKRGDVEIDEVTKQKCIKIKERCHFNYV